MEPAPGERHNLQEYLIKSTNQIKVYSTQIQKELGILEIIDR